MSAARRGWQAAASVALAVGALGLTAAPAPAQGSPPWLPSFPAPAGSFYSGISKAHNRLNVEVSADGRKIMQLVVGSRQKCRRVRGSGTVYRHLFGIAVRRGGFSLRLHSTAYGEVFTTSVSGKVNAGTVSVSFRSGWHSSSAGCDSGLVKVAAVRWAPADWHGATAQGLPISFHVGMFTRFPEVPGMIVAPIDHLTLVARATCNNGQAIQGNYDSGSAAVGEVGWSSGELPGVGPAKALSEGAASLVGKFGDPLSGMTGSVQSLFMPTTGPEVFCEAQQIGFSAHT